MLDVHKNRVSRGNVLVFSYVSVKVVMSLKLSVPRTLSQKGRVKGQKRRVKDQPGRVTGQKGRVKGQPGRVTGQKGLCKRRTWQSNRPKKARKRPTWQPNKVTGQKWQSKRQKNGE
jgi:hypothetical protein